MSSFEWKLECFVHRFAPRPAATALAGAWRPSWRAELFYGSRAHRPADAVAGRISFVDPFICEILITHTRSYAPAEKTTDMREGAIHESETRHYAIRSFLAFSENPKFSARPLGLTMIRS